MEEQVILVDKKNKSLGLVPKMEAHQKGLLHRAFSIFIFNDKGELLLQQRASTKYHSPLLWTNTCCSHQKFGETSLQAGKRRLQEEMGFVCHLKELFSFIYKAHFDNGLIEYEFDHVLIGTFNNNPSINKKEVEAYKWISLEALNKNMKKYPKMYTEWFKIIFSKYHSKLLYP